MAERIRVEYKPDPVGVRALGLSDGMKKATGQAASRVVSAANSLDPKGEYSAQGVGVYAGHRNEPRHGVVVEGAWWPGARTAALQRAVQMVAEGQKPAGSSLVPYTRIDGKTIMVTPAQKANYERIRKG